MGRAPGDFLNISTDMNTEVDALDPSIMDFALQGEAGGLGAGGAMGGGERGVHTVCIHPQLITMTPTEC
jgi:hypothetical protein